MLFRVQTVLGDVDISKVTFGVTLPREHLSSNYEYFYRKPADKLIDFIPESNYTLGNISYVRQYPCSSKYNLRLDDDDAYNAVLADLQAYKSFGGDAIVDTTSTGLSRNVTRLCKLSSTSKVHIIAGTGYYIEDVQTDDCKHYTTEDLYENMYRELTVGCVEDKTVKAGFIGELGSVWPLRDFERRVIKAAGEVQAQFHCGVTFSPASNPEAPFEIMRLYLEAGGSADKAVMGHLDRTFLDKEKLLEFSKLGCYGQFDMFGVEDSYDQIDTSYMPNDAKRMDMIKAWVAEAGENKVLMSHNIHTKHRLLAYGGHGYSHTTNDVIRRMRGKGISGSVIQYITQENPIRWLAIRGEQL